MCEVEIKSLDHQGRGIGKINNNIFANLNLSKNDQPEIISDKNNKCLSAITQQKGELNQKEIALIRQNKSVWGCDICQNLCPMNKNSSLTPIKAFINSYRNEFKEDEDFKNRAYTWRGENVIKRNLKIM